MVDTLMNPLSRCVRKVLACMMNGNTDHHKDDNDEYTGHNTSSPQDVLKVTLVGRVVRRRLRVVGGLGSGRGRLPHDAMGVVDAHTLNHGRHRGHHWKYLRKSG